MFTGLIDAVGVLDLVNDTAAGRVLSIRARYDDLVVGESIAVNGACLTVRSIGDGRFDVAAVVTTRDRTAIGTWASGRHLNLERAVRLSDRLGGHMVLGHVDGVGNVTALERRGDALLIDIDVPSEVAELLVPHGAIAVDGVSLTVNALTAPRTLQVSIIEHTERHTTLGDLAVGSAVHLEGDVIGKYVRQLVAPYRNTGAHGQGG
ncbi:MAG: Riboflavin synthase [Gemmatimonadaceae bacterium]|nr:Riboflavin synthase [Gemmatimonadaceae bacterium]